MSEFWRTLARWDLMRVGAATLAVAWLLILGAFVFAAISIQPSGVSIVAALAALVIAGTAILYAWREPGR